MGRGNIAGTGNDLNNVLRGNAGSNLLDGGKGDDILHSGPGTDVLRGGEGADSFIIHRRGGLVDHIPDFVSGSDRLRLDLDVPMGNSAADFTLSSQGGGSYLVYDSSIAMLFSNTSGPGGELVPIVSFDPGTLVLATDIVNWFPVV